MGEKEMFAPEMKGAEKGLEKEEKRLRYEIAKEDGVCEHCKGEYKKGDRIAMYKREEPNASDEKEKPYHTDCVDEEIFAAEKEVGA